MWNLEESFIWKPRLCYSPGGGSRALPEKSQHRRGAAHRRESVSTVDNPTPWGCSHSLERNQIACPYRRIVLKGLRCVTMWKKWAQLKCLWALLTAKCYWRCKGQALFYKEVLASALLFCAFVRRVIWWSLLSTNIFITKSFLFCRTTSDSVDLHNLHVDEATAVAESALVAFRLCKKVFTIPHSTVFS